MDFAGAPPLSLRRLRYFVAVAEELHFGRAAERLFVTQPVLSRQVRQLENELGTVLLQRSSRSVALTASGELLLDEGRPLLAAAERTRRRVQASPSESPTLDVGFFSGEAFTAALHHVFTSNPLAKVRLHRLLWHDQVEVLHDGRVDVAFVHLPVDERGLDLMPVRQEPRVAVLSSTHPMAHRTNVTLAELADDPVIVQRGASDAWQAFHNVDPRPDGRHPRAGPAVDTPEEKLELVATGVAISFMPASASAAYSHPGIAYVPVSDAAPIPVCLAWLARRRSPLVDAFIRGVRTTMETSDNDALPASLDA